MAARWDPYTLRMVAFARLRPAGARLHGNLSPAPRRMEHIGSDPPDYHGASDFRAICEAIWNAS
jgi:hypothetical protein